MTDSSAGKRAAAQAALKFVDDDAVIGVGTGSTVNFFIDALASRRDRIRGAVSARFDTQGQIVGVSLFCPSLDEVAIENPASDETLATWTVAQRSAPDN